MTGRVAEAGANPYEIITGPGGTIDFVHGSGGDRLVKADRIADNPFPSYHDHQSQLFETGLFLTNHLSPPGARVRPTSPRPLTTPAMMERCSAFPGCAARTSVSMPTGHWGRWTFR